MKIAWTKVSPGKAVTMGVNSPNPGWVGRSADGFVYFVWVQARPRDDGPQYAAAPVGKDGHVVGGASQGRVTAWLCTRGSVSDAKASCETDAERRRG